MKKQKTQEPELLKEFLSFGSIFGLSFMQSIFGGGGEPYDPEFEEFLKDQEELGRTDIIDKIRDMEKEDLQNPETRAWLNKQMEEMPDEIQQAAAEQFAIEAGEQVNDFQQALGTVGVAFSEGEKRLEEVAKSIEANPEQLKKIYLKYAGANAKQLVGLWQKFSEAVQKTEGSKGKAKVHPETLKTMKLDFDASQFQGLISEALSDDIPVYLKGLSNQNEEEEKGEQPEQAEPDHWVEEFMKPIDQSLVKLKEELDLLKGFASEEQNIFGIGTATAAKWASRMEAVLGDVSTSMKKRFPNEVAKIAAKAGKRRGARGKQDPSTMSQSDRIQMTSDLISAIDKASKDNDQKKLAGLIPQLKTYAPDKVLKSLAKQKPELAKHLNEYLKRKSFYESFGDFS